MNLDENSNQNVTENNSQIESENQAFNNNGQDSVDEEKTKKSNKENKTRLIIIIILVLLVLLLGVLIIFKIIKSKDNENNNANISTNTNTNVNTDADTDSNKNENTIIDNNIEIVKENYVINSNSLENFDLYFMQVENNEANMIYSPLSIKYALEMLSEGTNGETKKQIDDVLSKYVNRKYQNNANISFANAFFIRDAYKNNINANYINTLNEKYNAEVIYDNFLTPNKINSWVSDKTFNLINNLFNDVSSEDFLLVNSLAINMRWKYLIQQILPSYDINDEFLLKKYDLTHTKPGTYDWIVYYYHENTDSMFIDSIKQDVYSSLLFDNKINAKSVEFGAAINNYDIVSILGEENIRKEVGKAYEDWVKEDKCGYGSYEDTDTFLNNYIKEIDSNYQDVASSTDFRFYDDDNVKAFAKELQEYNGVTLEYISIMPKNQILSSYIKNLNAQNINNIINNLKTIELNNFDNGYITKISGKLPLFNYEYELKLKEDLQKLGITNVFNDNADLSNMLNTNNTIDKVVHKTNIEFSNEGIKAASSTGIFGGGGAYCAFDYKYDVPVKEIDLTFDKPFMYLIRDINTNEIWFAGTVYTPIENDQLKR
ncbi:MAG: serpin family protein [Bacilli bacterium]